MKKDYSTLVTGIVLTVTVLTSTYAVAESDPLSFEVGLGANNSIAGVTVNYEVADSVEVFAGGGIGYVAGVKYYVTNNVRLTINHGTNSLLIGSGSIASKRFEGTNIGVGYASDRDGGWVIDLMYIDASKAKDYFAKNPNIYTLNDGKVKLSFGYRW